jgi:hypothetical protein
MIVEGMTKFERFLASWMRLNQYSRLQFWDWFGCLEWEQQQRIL